MSAIKDVPAAYAASCNPPRRAKRYRTGSLVDHDGPSMSVAQSPPQRRVARPPILPKQPSDKGYHLPPSPDTDSPSDEEDEYEPGRDATAAPAPKRRGRKPGTLSRSARESLRKLNHSKIEKARRTKINETLATLSSLVNDRASVLPGAGADVAAPPTKEDEAKGKKGKGKAEEKEFKLDVLVKTVEFMQDLISRVKTLEGAMCAQCRAADRPIAQDANIRTARDPLKRKRADVEELLPTARHKRPHSRLDDDECYGGDDEHGLANSVEDEQPSPMPFVSKPSATSPAAAASSSPRLPPIASWLPHPYMDPSSLMSASPSMAPVATRSPTNMQLPSPPSSGRFRPAATLSNMPALALPGPAQPLDAPPKRPVVLLPRQQQQQQRRQSVSASPSVSPTWTPEDETAASLLLEMSSKPSSSSAASSRSPPALPGPGPGLGLGPLGLPTPREERAFEVATPSSLLGMRD
ncbi:hypothetical protein PYCCODRAFT_1414259 [Trametes coccinea BRFM310]|uniref:BHLH domain-containing protein n=1 Tax=Trametes coccinea (strain BRFM310) TaxID=1353009 RepID=A0A1Y2IKS1_TRAC3|nr:hypothetical protein PYCCODRAFT_1414259 [Trametes coccinea BRFM310]